MPTRRQFALAASLACGATLSLGLAAAPALASSWPERPITLVIPFPPGGGTDVLGRLLAQQLEPILGQTLIVDNRPGATGNIGAAYVAKARPDGYTLLLQGTVIGMYPHVYPSLAYDPLRDLAPISTVAETPDLIIASTASPIKTYAQLAAAAANPARPLNYGSAGTGSPQHLGMELARERAGLQLQHVAYRGASPAVVDVLGGQLDFGVFTLSSSLPFIREGKFNVLASISRQRSALLPEVPAVSELGLEEVESGVRLLLLAPPGTPEAVIQKLNAAIHQAGRQPAFVAKLAEAGYQPILSTPDEARAMIQAEFDTWGPVVRRLNLQAGQ